LRPFLGDGRLTLLTASMADKDAGGVVAALAGSATLADARVVATTIDAPRAMPAGELASIWARSSADGDPRSRTVTSEPELASALDRALSGPPGPLVVAGSLYLVGAIRALLVDDLLLRDPAPPTASPADSRDNLAR
ncbi:MAG: hypothetical protein H0U52_04540, partial [Chloroflexi bacterium]|nr:hypothetical protein [Chloroflexota bacterium]